MSGMDRRAFLIGAFRGSPTADTGGGSSQDRAIPAKVADSPVIIIGRLRDFPIGETRKAGARDLFIESSCEGLRARAGIPGGPCFGISVNAFGELMVDTSEIWDEGMVYSIMIAGPIRLDPTLEENNERR